MRRSLAPAACQSYSVLCPRNSLLLPSRVSSPLPPYSASLRSPPPDEEVRAVITIQLVVPIESVDLIISRTAVEHIRAGGP
jgi:hypothetical protein